MHFDEKVFKLRGVCFKIMYLMTNQNLSSTFKRNFYLTKILSNAPLMWDTFFLASIHKYRVDGLLSGGVWTFSDGTPITDVYWYPGEPAGGGVSIGLRVGHNGKWDDISPVINHGTICEKELSFN